MIPYAKLIITPEPKQLTKVELLTNEIKQLIGKKVKIHYGLKWSWCTSMYTEYGIIQDVKIDYCNGWEITFNHSENGIIFIPVKSVLSIQEIV
jgi:hypothetical protein